MTFDSILQFSNTLTLSIPHITIVEGYHARVVGTGKIDLKSSFKLQFD